jgi:hypothetical protein
MTKKDYIKIANILRAYKLVEGTAKTMREMMISDFCNMLKTDNPNFNKEMFTAFINK